jgi:hypothetical protein
MCSPVAGSPQPPQFLGSLLVSTQESLQHCPAGQDWPPQPQAPSSHVSPSAQTLSQLPQLLGSLFVSMQFPLQQVSPAAHAVPHAPQFWSSTSRSTHVSLQQLSPETQSDTHSLLKHFWQGGHSTGTQVLPTHSSHDGQPDWHSPSKQNEHAPVQFDWQTPLMQVSQGPHSIGSHVPVAGLHLEQELLHCFGTQTPWSQTSQGPHFDLHEVPSHVSHGPHRFTQRPAPRND